MTAPKKPARRSTRIQAVADRGTPPVLTDAESAWLAAYRAMDDKARVNMLRAMRRMAIEFPRAPRLRLVTGGGT